MLSIKKVFAHSIKQIFLVCFLVITFSLLSVFGQTQKTQEAQQLAANQTIERELGGGQTHKYLIKLKASEFLQIRAEQKGADVVVRLLDSSRKQLVEIDSPNGSTGFEELLFITEKAGEYEIQISALDEKAATGKYVLQWSKQNATEKNRSQINAKKLYEDGFDLFENSGTKGEAITKVKEALKIYQQIGDLEGQLNCLQNLGSYLTFEDRKTAREYFNQALPITRKLGDKLREANLLYFLSFTYSHEEHQKELNYLNQALLILNNRGDKIREANILRQIGSVYNDLRDYQKGLKYLNRALSLYRTDNSNSGKIAVVGLLSTISIIYELSGDKQKALDYRNESELLRNQLSIKPGSVTDLLRKAMEFAKVGDYQKQIEYLKQAILVTKDNIVHPLLLQLIGKVYSTLGDKEKAVEYLDKALLEFRADKNQNMEAHVLHDFGDLHGKLGDNQKALEFYNQALLLYRASGERGNEASILSAISDFLLSIGKTQLAVVYGKQAINTIQQIRSNIKELDKDTRQNFLKDKEPIYRKLADILISEGRFPEAQAVLDLLKEEEFKQIVRRSGKPLFTLPYSRSEEEAIKIVDRLAALGRELSDLKAKPKDSLTAAETKRFSEIDAEIIAANKVLRQAIESLSTVAPDVKNALELKMKDNIQNILPALGSGVVALYTVIGKTTADENATDKAADSKINIGWILLVTPEFRKAYPIDTKDLEQTVFKLREALRSPANDPQPVAEELYKKLFLQTSEKQKTTLAADLETYLGNQKDKTLMWSLDGILRYVPMAALHDGKGYLVEKYRNVVFNTASLGSLKDAVKANWEVVGLGVSTEGTVKAFDGRMLRFSALKGSESELNSIIKEKNQTDTEGIFPGTLKINNNFTKEALFEGARTGMPVIHISSHFWFNPAQEETSFLLLGNSDRLEITEFQDYPNLFSNVDLLSLSACDTATGGNADNRAVGTGKAENQANARETNGKEIEGFAYLAQTLGAKSVMASLWQVSDQGTKELMLKFYQIKKEHPELPKSEALRQAQLSLLHGTDKTLEIESGKKDLILVGEEKEIEQLKTFKKDEKMPFAHPYYWSPFILIGNWR